LTCGYVELTIDTKSYNAATEPGLNIELSINKRHALKSAAARLQIEFADAFDTENVEQLVYSSYEELAAHATVRDFLPLLAVRFARQPLHAIAKTKGKLTNHELVVLFLCNHNAGRSQMAMGLINRLAGGGAVVWSGGSEPTGKINPAAVDIVPALPGRRYEDWDLDDPSGKDVAEVRLIRDQIERRVRELLDDLRIPYRS
jgi:arsenate reductase (thioredoxin)